jgi:ATP-dependent protease ClpP protease subunit
MKRPTYRVKRGPRLITIERFIRDVATYREVIDFIQRCITEDPEKPIIIQFEGSGGYVLPELFELINEIRNAPCQITGVAGDNVASAIAFIFLSCHRRIISEHACIELHGVMMHLPVGMCMPDGKIPEEAWEQVLEEQRQVEELLKDKTGLEHHHLYQEDGLSGLMQSDAHIFPADAALSFGMVESIM